MINDLKIIPLGGQEEVGRNMTIFEYGNDIILLDMGMQFPEDDMPGIDFIIPNIKYLENKEKKIRAVVFTHGHMDHIGAAPILLEKLGYPQVIGLPLTIALIRKKMEDIKKGSSKYLKAIEIKDIKERIKLNSFELGFFDVEHSIMDSCGITLKTPVGTVIHTGDWTLGTEMNSNISYNHLSSLPKPTILMMECLGAVNRKPLKTEEEMWINLSHVFNNAPGRVIVATFSSQVKRVRDIITYAQKTGKKVAVDGFSMKLNLKTAQELGYVKAAKNTLIDIKDINKYPDNKIIVIGTGAQGESRAVMARIVTGNHRYIKLKRKDTVVFSSSIIPGNERTIQRLKDDLYRQCDHVIHSEIMDIHVGGHNNVDAIKTIIKQIKPTYLLPVYAHHYMLKEAAKIAIKDGFNEKNIFILDNGHIIKFSKDKAPMIMKTKVETDYIFIDGVGHNNLEAIVLRDRRALAEDGMFVIVATVNSKSGKIISSPDIISRGFVRLDTSKELLYQARKKAVNIIQASTSKNTSVDWNYIKKNLKNKLGDFFYQKTGRRPMILPVITEV